MSPMRVSIESFDINNISTNLSERFPEQLTRSWLLVSIEKQCLYLLSENKLENSYPISTSKFGVGCEQDSYKTPPGAHVIAQKIGDQCAMNEILRGRQATGECAQILDQAEVSQHDLILTRILWLQGLEAGKNLGEGIDSFQRYIYIHGTQEEGLIGTPVSHGCVRMLNKDVIELYERVNEGTFVYVL